MAMTRWQRRLLFPIGLCVCFLALVSGASLPPTNDPYRVLGVSSEAPQEEIRRRYRQLCLEYHPDKNVNKSSRERARCEAIFKEIQEANSKIGDETARRNFDNQHELETYTYDGYNEPPNFWSHFFGKGPIKSVYVQEVSVALRDLHMGRDRMDLVLNENVWTRYRALLRGKFGRMFLLRSVLTSVLLMPLIGVRLVFGTSAVLLHCNVPKPTKLHYKTSIQSGWKSGTKLTFREVEPGFDVVFVIKEESDGRYQRVGNDLLTSIYITSLQAKKGFKTSLDPLSDLDDAIPIKLRPNQIKESGQNITIKGKGWFHRKTGRRGDLIVVVLIVGDQISKERKKDVEKFQ